MDKKPKRGAYLNLTLALLAMAIGMVVIAFYSLGSPGSFQLGILGCLLALYACVRLTIYNRPGGDWDE